MQALGEYQPINFKKALEEHFFVGLKFHISVLEFFLFFYYPHLVVYNT